MTYLGVAQYVTSSSKITSKLKAQMEKAARRHKATQIGEISADFHENGGISDFRSGQVVVEDGASKVRHKFGGGALVAEFETAEQALEFTTKSRTLYEKQLGKDSLALCLDTPVFRTTERPEAFDFGKLTEAQPFVGPK